MTPGAPRPHGAWRRWGVWLVALACACLAAAAVGIGQRASSESTSCTAACHTDDALPPDFVAHANHDAVPCQSCHATSRRDALALALTGALGLTPRAHGTVNEKVCSTCHTGNSDRWRLVADTSGHRQHARADGVTCLSCHRESTHGAKKAAARCGDCHSDDRLHAHTARGDACVDCHNFASGDDKPPPATIARCDSCHADEQRLRRSRPGATLPASLVVNAEMLHGSVDCKQCHQPHRPMPTQTVRGATGKVDEEVLAGDRVCQRCHEVQVGALSDTVPDGHKNCVKCHGAHAPLDQFALACRECHEEGRAKPQGKQSTALHHESCASCHVPHTWRAARAGCVQCHDEKAALVQREAPTGHQQCQDCHKPHEAMPGGATCVTCHKNRRAHLASAPTKHKDCASCHDPHTTRADPKQACPTCHAGETRQVVQLGPSAHAERSCTGCHQPHGNPIPTTKLCAGCHRTQSSALATTAPPEKHRDCRSCHKPHRFTIARAADACRSCHDSIVRAPGPHAAACDQCHTPHGSPLVSRTQCAGCHQNVKLKPPPGNAPHANCGSCHLPHRPAIEARGRCGSCHGDKLQVAKTWPLSSPHGGDCKKCHEPHAVRTIASCQSCHAAEATSAQGSKHRCNQCHAPHQSAPAGKAGWWGRCATCHGEQASQAKTGKAHERCADCHKPHRFAVPSCNTCHAGEIKKAGHAVKGHADCSNCHTTHLADLPDRARCLSCHKDMTQHQTAAKLCQACHPFK